MAELTGIPIPTIDWKAQNLPEALKKFKLIFEGPLTDKPDKTKLLLLLLWEGETGRDIKNSWNLADGDETVDKHWEKSEAYVTPKSNFRVARFQLRALKQKEGEAIDSFITKAKIILADCDYTNKEEQLLDCIIAGVHNETTRRKLIAKAKNMTVEQALTMIRAHECTTRQMNDIQEA
ncbi:uncharacterized protein [Antedon mediterranea]|uniref:uncharacterized protein n=1 Tax=Antedon mediterranea TaxID=105859 RepID=UPI003AF96113